MSIEPTDPHTQQEPRFAFLLVDRIARVALARIYSTQTTIDTLNKPQWMQSRMWRYEREDQCLWDFK